MDPRLHVRRGATPRSTAAAVVGSSCALLAACVALPGTGELPGATAPHHGGPLPAQFDARARYRQVYCDLARGALDAAGPPEKCDDVLWRLPDEPRVPPRAASAAATQIDPHLHVLVVGGAFSDCREPPAIAFEESIARLTARGVRIRSIPVSGRSGPEANARRIATALQAEPVDANGRVVLVGYSKGAVDALQFLVDYPAQRAQVVALVSVAGAVRGSPLAERGEWWYRTFLEDAFEGVCDPGDGQVVASLRPGVREAWLVANPLPADVRYYSIAGFPAAEHLGRGLAVTWRMLARQDRRNDGQVLAADAIVPGSTVLGYFNADHWDLALDLQRQVPHLSARPVERALPRAELLEAALLIIGEDLAGAGPRVVAAGGP
jgi:hypothetical protein